MPLSSVRFVTLFRPVVVAFATIALCVPTVRNAEAAQSSAVAPAPSPSASASASPTVPKPKPTASGLTVSGQVRAYAFDRENGTQNASNPNRTAFNAGGNLHLDYQAGTTPLHFATTYYGAYPFGVNGTKPQFNGYVDNTLPGFALSTFGEAYARYASKKTNATLGDQSITTPFANASDSRIKPALFQGLEFNQMISPGLTVGIDRMIAFENRTSSLFTRNTLLTSRPAGNPNYSAYNTSGFLLADARYTKAQLFSASANFYQFYNLAQLGYGEVAVGLAPNSRYQPTLAGQYVTEHQNGSAYAGLIDNNTAGARLSAKLDRNTTISAAFDESPTHYAMIVAKSAAAASAGFFAPAGGTIATKLVSPGLYEVAYGGIASPYTEAYASDPVYTTSITQGMVDRHSGGDSYKAALTYLTDNQRFRGIFSYAYYDYDNAIGANRTSEDDYDITYFVTRPPVKGPFKGLSLRERYADRSQQTLPYDFKYVRTQLEYDF